MQGILLAILVGTGAIASAEDAGNVQNLLICLEMLPASIAMFFAFPHSEYLEGGAWACNRWQKSIYSADLPCGNPPF